MTYTKPEVAVLGDAASVILGAPNTSTESQKAAPGHQGADGDLGD